MSHLKTKATSILSNGLLAGTDINPKNRLVNPGPIAGIFCRLRANIHSFGSPTGLSRGG